MSGSKVEATKLMLPQFTTYSSYEGLLLGIGVAAAAGFVLTFAITLVAHRSNKVSWVYVAAAVWAIGTPAWFAYERFWHWPAKAAVAYEKICNGECTFIGGGRVPEKAEDRRELADEFVKENFEYLKSGQELASKVWLAVAAVLATLAASPLFKKSSPEGNIAEGLRGVATEFDKIASAREVLEERLIALDRDVKKYKTQLVELAKAKKNSEEKKA